MPHQYRIDVLVIKEFVFIRSVYAEKLQYVAIISYDLVLLEMKACIHADLFEVSIRVACIPADRQCFLHVLLEPAVLSTVDVRHVHQPVVKLMR